MTELKEEHMTYNRKEGTGTGTGTQKHRNIGKHHGMHTRTQFRLSLIVTVFKFSVRVANILISPHLILANTKHSAHSWMPTPFLRVGVGWFADIRSATACAYLYLPESLYSGFGIFTLALAKAPRSMQETFSL
jgi:hypothetical protein